MEVSNTLVAPFSFPMIRSMGRLQCRFLTDPSPLPPSIPLYPPVPPQSQKFLFFVLKSSDVLDILVPILFYLNDSRADQCEYSGTCSQ